MGSKGISEQLRLKGKVGSFSFEQGDRLLIDTSSLLWKTEENPVEVEVFAIAEPMHDQCIGVVFLEPCEDKNRVVSRSNFRSWNVSEQDITKHYQKYLGKDYIWIATRHVVKKLSSTYNLDEIVNNLENEVSNVIVIHR